MNIKNVLVPVDFSPPSRLAVGYGVSLARRFRGKLTLVHVVESPPAVMHRLAWDRSRMEKQQSEQALRMMSALVAPEDQDDLDLGIVVRTGERKDEIAAAIVDQHADIAVMGTHGRGFFGRLLIGSVTEGVLRTAGIPVLTVSRVVRPLTFDRILFATDLSPESRQAFQLVTEMAPVTHSAVIVIHAMQRPPVTYGGGELVQYVSEDSIAEARKALADFIEEAKSKSVTIDTVIFEEVPADAILKTAADSDVDLIVLAVRKKGLLERALLGTTAERVIREAQVPVLSVPSATV
jgi:nucleotide-binding universal stress UspA family protein